MATGAIVSAIVGVVGAAASTTAAVVTSKNANKANRTNTQSQQEFITKMTDPSYIRERQTAAGYNAQLLASPNSLGQVGSSPTYQPTQIPDMSGISQGIQSAMNFFLNYKQADADAKLKSQQAEQVHIENQYKMQQGLAEISKTLEDTKDVRTRRQLNEILQRYQEKIYQSDLQMTAEQINQIKEQTKGQVMENVMSSIRLKNLPEMMRLDIANSAADLAIRKQTERLTAKQVEHEAYKIAQTIAQTNLYDEQLNTQQQVTKQATAQASVSDATRGYQIETIKAAMIHAINNTESDNLFQAIPKGIRSMSDKWRSLNPF